MYILGAIVIVGILIWGYKTKGWFGGTMVASGGAGNGGTGNGGIGTGVGEGGSGAGQESRIRGVYSPDVNSFPASIKSKLTISESQILSELYGKAKLLPNTPQGVAILKALISVANSKLEQIGSTIKLTPSDATSKIVCNSYGTTTCWQVNLLLIIVCHCKENVSKA